MYTTASWAVPHMVELAKQPDTKPLFIVTSGGLSFNPRPNRFALAASKAAQLNLTLALGAQWGSQGVHFVGIVVAGIVGPGNGVFDPANISEVYWAQYKRGVKEGDGKDERTVWIKDASDPSGTAYQRGL